jgi:hypothetical protein
MIELPEQPWSSPEAIRLDAAMGLVSAYDLLDDQVHTPGVVYPPTPHCTAEKITVRETGSPVTYFERPRPEIIRMYQKGSGLMIVNVRGVTQTDSLERMQEMTAMAHQALVAIRAQTAEASLLYM